MTKGTWRVDPKTGALVLLPPKPAVVLPKLTTPVAPKLYTGLYL